MYDDLLEDSFEHLKDFIKNILGDEQEKKKASCKDNYLFFAN